MTLNELIGHLEYMRDHHKAGDFTVTGCKLITSHKGQVIEDWEPCDMDGDDFHLNLFLKKVVFQPKQS